MYMKSKSLTCMFNYMYTFTTVHVLPYLPDENCHSYLKHYDNKGYSSFSVFGLLLRCLKLSNVTHRAQSEPRSLS